MSPTIIRRKRIRSLARHLVTVPPDSEIALTVPVIDKYRDALKKVGFGTHPTEGETVLPAVCGPVSRFNAEGREDIRRDLPMEELTYERLWTWNEWHGNDTVQREKIVDIPYSRYPRDFVPPPSVELHCTATEAGELLVVVNGGAYTPANETNLLHRINLMLELFGDVEVRDTNLTPFAPAEVRHLNWDVLPTGRHPWQKTRAAMKPILERAKAGKRPVIEARLDTIGKYHPSFVALGRAGFAGYIVFGFESLGIYVLESAYYGNATYVLGEDWEHLSQKTKAELLDNDLHKERIIHRAASWTGHINKLLAPALKDKAA